MPITEYCDDNKLTIQQRLELFIEVCRAVQHAHQKGIIHRDIKPSNVLVALYDGKPVPKIIDFGVAKAISQRLTERTMFTQYGQIVGTLEYMSPEQAQFNQLDIDTRSDIYSLGVLLYELLTGVTPFDGKRLRSSAYEEVLRILKEEEPPKPSKRISTLGEDAIAISNSRASQPEGLGRVVRGDLDWVVMKALEKDRTSRYETANAFGEDLCRYLNDEAVHARSPSLAYKARKFVRRNRVGVSVSTILLLLLVIGTIATVWGFVVLRRKNRQLADLYFVQALEAAINGNESTAQAVVQEATKLNVLSDAQLEMLKGQRFLYTGKTNLAFEHLEAAILMQPDAILPHAMLATAYALGMGVQDPGKPLAIAESLARQKKRLEPLEILFLGQAQYYFHDTKIGLKTLASLPEDFQSPLADAIWADGLTHQANEEGDLVVIEDALKRLDRAQAYMPQNAYVAMVHVWAHTIALRLLDPSDERTPVLRDRGLKAASELERHSEFPVARGVRLMFLLENAPDLALASVRERLDDSNWHVQGAILYASGDREYINRLLAASDRSAWMNQNAVAFTLGFDDRHSETVRQVYSQLKGNRERDAKWYLPEAFLLLQGDDDFRISECHARLDERLAGWDELAIKFVGQCGVSEQEFLEGSVTRRQRGRARLILGLWHMRAGNLSDAKRHLQECVKVKYGIQFYWADAYLARMASDDGWPAVRGARTRSN